jgi:hypothetical protein
MEYNKIIKSLDTCLPCCLLTILILSALAFIFAFIINWEDWFFGTKLDGMPAGLFLLVKAVTAIVLAGLLVQILKYKKIIILVTVAYFGFLLFNSAATIQKNTAGRESFSILLAVFFLIPVLYFFVNILATRLDREENSRESGSRDEFDT